MNKRKIWTSLFLAGLVSISTLGCFKTDIDISSNATTKISRPSIISDNITISNKAIKKHFIERIEHSECTDEEKIAKRKFTVEELNSIDGAIEISDSTITELEGFEYLVDMKMVHVNNCTNLTDVSSLTKLSKLEQLHMKNCNVQDMSSIAKMTTLQLLDITSNGVSDISPLVTLKNLKVITLKDNPIRDLSPLYEMDNLRMLVLGDNPLDDITQIFKLTELETLVLSSELVDEIPGGEKELKKHLPNTFISIIK